MFILILLMSGKPCQIAIPKKLNVQFQGGICPEKRQIDKFQNGRHKAIIVCNMGNIGTLCVIMGMGVLLHQGVFPTLPHIENFCRGFPYSHK